MVASSPGSRTARYWGDTLAGTASVFWAGSSGSRATVHQHSRVTAARIASVESGLLSATIVPAHELRGIYETRQAAAWLIHILNLRGAMDLDSTTDIPTALLFLTSNMALVASLMQRRSHLPRQ